MWIPTKKTTMDKAGDTKSFTKRRNIRICGYQSHKANNNILLIRFILDNSQMDEEECEDVKGRDDESSDSSYSPDSKPSNQKKVLALKNK